MRKPDFAYAKTKAQISFAVIAKLISAIIVFATRIVQFLFYIKPKFHDSSFFPWVYKAVLSDLVGHHEDRFSHDAAQLILNNY